MQMSDEERRSAIYQYIHILEQELKKIDSTNHAVLPPNIRRAFEAEGVRLVKELGVLRRAYALAEREMGDDRDRALAALAHFGISLPQDDGDTP